MSIELRKIVRNRSGSSTINFEEAAAALHVRNGNSRLLKREERLRDEVSTRKSIVEQDEESVCNIHPNNI